MGKRRIDLLIHEMGLADSREKARAYIMAGQVSVGGSIVEKPSELFEDSVEIVIAHDREYASRGGLKLEKALQVFGVCVEGLTIMDVGASTGGFTDCLLKNGAARVYSIDVGYGQLDWKLRQDDRVIVMERTNARYLEPEHFAYVPDGAVMDVSFISIRNILPALERCLKPGAFIISLIKPQFEAGRDKVGKKGIIRDKNTHIEVLSGICGYINGKTGFRVVNLDFSPIKGQKGNIEYLVYCRNDGNAVDLDIEEIVSLSHNHLPKA